MTNASPLLCPGDLDPDDPPTLVWCSRMLSIPHTPKTGPGKAPVLQPFAFDPVFDLCLEGRLPEGQTAANGIRHRHYRVITATAEVLGVDRGRVYRWTKRGLTADQADVIAIMFGLHPA